MGKLYLQVPQITELDYRRALLYDVDTMNYNKEYGVNGTGCYFISKEELEILKKITSV